VKLLRVLEARAFERVGGTQQVKVDVRLVAATNRNLQTMIKEGTFREDLYYRLNVVRVPLPPLRDRGEDITLLVHHFLDHFREENNKTVVGITPDAMDALATYDWPGNIRELRNVVERMIVLCKGDRLTLRDIPPDLKTDRLLQPSLPVDKKATMKDAEKTMIIRALADTKGNRTHAAKQLGISRRTLHRKLKLYDID